MNFLVLVLFVLLLFFVYMRAKENMFTRANSYDVSQYESNVYPCINESKPMPHFQT